MQRDGETIIYSEKDRAEFNVPSHEPAREAVITAAGLHKAAATISERAVAIVDSTNKEAAATKKWLEYRAGRLATFSARIFDLCPNEHLDFILDNTPRGS